MSIPPKYLERGGQAYIRNLVAAEQAILHGQFNTAKVLRACAHSQRIMAMEAGRLLADEYDARDLFNVILEEIDSDKDFGPFYSSTAGHLGQLSPEAIINILEGIPNEVEAAIVNVNQAMLQQKPSADEWSIAEIIGHMLETDLLFVKRAQALLEAQGKELPWPMPPWKLQEGKGYETMQSRELLAYMRAARTQSLALIRAMTPEDWMRKGLSFGSKISMLDLGTWLANHDRGHLAQIKRQEYVVPKFPVIIASFVSSARLT